MIKAGHPVFFGCDVNKFSDQTAGILDTALFEYEVSKVFLTNEGNKYNYSDRVLLILRWVLQKPNVYKLTNHLWFMPWWYPVFIWIQRAIRFDTRLRIHGEKLQERMATLSWPIGGSNSKFTCTLYRFLSCNQSKRFVYQIVVPKNFAPKDLVLVYESGEKIVLPPWDPMVCRNTVQSLIEL